jgi:hypothetical protein
MLPLAKKKNIVGVPPLTVRFGQTEAASDFGSVCLAEAKSEVHTEAPRNSKMKIPIFT